MATDVAGELLSVVEAASESLRRIGDPEASLKSAPATGQRRRFSATS